MATDDRAYRPRDAIGEAIKATMYTGGAGLLVSAVQTSLAKENIGAMSVFTRSGGTIGIFGAMGGAYTFTKLAAANLRERDDAWNTALGGFFGGAALAMRARTLPAVFLYGGGAAVILSAFDYTGGKLSSYDKDPGADEFERKEHLRKNRRRPIQQTLEELGEGRGIYGPGYEERRRERLRQAYGIDVQSS